MTIGHSNKQIEHKGKETESSLVSSEAENVSCTSVAAAYSIENDCVSETKALVSELCRQFYGLGWVLGTGGSVSIKVHDEKISKSKQIIIMAPSGVQKERMMPEDMYVLSSEGFVLSTPLTKPYPLKSPKCSECAPLFLKAYEMCNAGAVIHSHGIESCLVTMIRPFTKEFRITHTEMIKGIKGHGYHDELVIPIIENTAQEGELIESFMDAIRSYPRSSAVLVRNHGVYIWGETWISAKTQAECYHYLFDAAVKLYRLGHDWSAPDHGAIYNTNGSISRVSGNFPKFFKTESFGSDNTIDLPQRCILLSMEGTTTPISFVDHVVSNFADDKLVKQSKRGNKLLQSKKQRIWVQSNDIEGLFYADVPKALKRWHASGIKVYVFSRCSRSLQHLLFGNSNHGDLRKYLFGYFDITLGSKNKKRTFMEILLTVGVNRPADMLYMTDNIEEACAARTAGMGVTLLFRPGNEPCPQDHGFTTAESLLETC